MDDKKKKKFVNPEAEVVQFDNDDILAFTSGVQAANWEDDDNPENWSL